MALFGPCSKWGTFTWGDGTQWCNRKGFVDKYVCQVDDVLDEPVHRLSVTINHSDGSLMNIFSILPLVSLYPYDLHHNSAQVDTQFYNKISVTVNHSNGTLMVLDKVRPHISSLPYDIRPYSAQVDQTFFDKISITVNHSNGTLMVLNKIRPTVRIHKRRLSS